MRHHGTGMAETVSVYSDGASRGNPGDAAYAFVVVQDDAIVDRDTGYLGEATNNQAEYHAVINALEHLMDTDVDQIAFHSDSQLIVNQLNGAWDVNDPQLRDLYERAQDRRDAFETVTFTHLPREHEYITVADRLCNQTLDERA